MVAKFRVMRLSCHIQLREVAEAANISPQRLNQFETKYNGIRPQNPERLIRALESLVAQRKREIEKVEHICRRQRETIFNFVEEGEKL